MSLCTCQGSCAHSSVTILAQSAGALQGCGTFSVSAWATLAAASHGHGLDVFSYRKPLFLTVAVTCWSVRLAGFLFYRVLQTGKDKCASHTVSPGKRDRL